MADRPSQKAVSDFVSEAQENIEALDRDLLRLEDTRHGQEADPDTLNAVFRAAHSLKGLSAPALFSRIIGEEAEQKPAATAAAAADLAARLGGGEAAPVAAQDLLDGLDLAEGVRGVLTEYEEHRLRA